MDTAAILRVESHEYDSRAEGGELINSEVTFIGAVSESLGLKLGVALLQAAISLPPAFGRPYELHRVTINCHDPFYQASWDVDLIDQQLVAIPTS